MMPLVIANESGIAQPVKQVQNLCCIVGGYRKKISSVLALGIAHR